MTSVDTTKKTVTLEKGKETISYDTLILASGGVPRRLPIEGADLENVYTLRNVHDAQMIDTGIYICPPLSHRDLHVPKPARKGSILL